jgi:hypothetical protein
MNMTFPAVAGGIVVGAGINIAASTQAHSPAVPLGIGVAGLGVVGAGLFALNKAHTSNAIAGAALLGGLGLGMFSEMIAGTKFVKPT